MAHISPTIQNGILTELRDGSPVQIVVGTSDWYAWLQTASAFTFQSEEGLFTAHKERAGNRRGRAYWRAYHTWHGKLHRAYLGQSEDLTLERLQSVAVALAHQEESEDLLEEPGPEGKPRPSSEAFSKATTHRRRASGTLSPHKAVRLHPRLTSLPAPLSVLIGREQEVQAICDLLAHPEVRLLTITGTGGVGKTRLALEVAYMVYDYFPDGVCFVPLAPVSDPNRIMAAIAQALGLWEIAALPLEEQVHATLRDRRLLLLLDNFEHIITAAPQLARLLIFCPGINIFVTSRAALHLSGEYEFPIHPLEVPDLTHLPEPEALSQQASVRLFVQRTQTIQPSFHVTPANACAVASICVQLDGLPLAIELASARSKLLPPQALLKRLSHRLELLTGGAQDLPTRQQTLRNTLKWSYDLLTEEEKRLFRWLSIFVGGCTLEAAEAVCQASMEWTYPVLEGIMSLLDKSLVQQTEREGEEPRLVMLETLREFGLECLKQEGELEAALQAHARYYLAQAEQAEPHLFDPEQSLWLVRLERDLDNLRTILQAAKSGREEEMQLALRLASALRIFWLGRGYLREGRSVLEQLLASTHAIVAPVRLKALKALGAILWVQSDARRLAQVADESLVLAQEQGDQLNLTTALILRGTALMLDQQDNAPTGQVCLEQAVTEARAIGDHLTLVWALTSLGRLAWYRQDAPWAIACLEESLALCRDMGDRVLMSAVLVLLAQAEISQGHTERARALLEENLSIYQALGHSWGIGQIFSLLGRLAIQQGELGQAETFLADAARLAWESGDQRSLARTRLLLAGVALLRGDLAVARQWYEEGLATALDIGHMNYIASGLKGLGCAVAALGLHIWAAMLWGAAEHLRESRSVVIPQALYEHMVAVVRDQLGEPAFEQVRARGRSITPAQALASPEAFASQFPHQAQAALAAIPTFNVQHSSYPIVLTAREVEVLRLVTQGLSDAQIADQLVISRRTVNWHLTVIYSKLGVSSRAAATRYAIEQHVV